MAASSSGQQQLHGGGGQGGQQLSDSSHLSTGLHESGVFADHLKDEAGGASGGGGGGGGEERKQAGQSDDSSDMRGGDGVGDGCGANGANGATGAFNRQDTVTRQPTDATCTKDTSSCPQSLSPPPLFFMLQPAAAEALRSYRYQGVDLSPISRYVLQPFWSRFVLLLPLDMAPNTVTLIGFVFILLSFLLSFWDFSQSRPPSSLHCLLHALCIFLYQTFDAVDGKQARRTNSSSPLGEMFDHGVDALVCIFATLPIASVTGCWAERALLLCLVSTATFFFSTWETYHTHVTLLPAVNGPTEGLLLLCAVCCWSALSGPLWWDRKLVDVMPMSSQIFFFINRASMRDIFLALFLSLGVLPSVAANMQRVLQTIAASIPTNSNWNALGSRFRDSMSLTMPYFVLVLLIAAWSHLSPDASLHRYPHLFFFSLACSFSLIVGLLLVAHLTSDSNSLLLHLCTPLCVPLLAASISLLSHLRGSIIISDFCLLLGYAVSSGTLYFVFVIGVIHDFCAALNVKCFSIRRESKSE